MNEQNNINNEIRLREKETSINLHDIFIIVLKKWYLFVISVVVCMTIAALYLMSAPKVYERTASILVKDYRTNPSESALFQELAIFDGKNNVNNEVIILKSHKLMTETVHRLKLDIRYTVKKGLRTKDLYSSSPFVISFVDVEETQDISLKARLLPNNEIAIWNFIIQDMENKETIVVRLNDTIDTPAGKIVFTPTLWYNETWIDKIITVNKANIKNTINNYRNAMMVNVTSSNTAVINLSIKNESIQRAEDVLNTVITIYNEDAINDKNIMAINTENFINERLIIIEEELGVVDDKIKDYKIAHQLTDLGSDAQLALQESSESDKRIVLLQNQHSMATYIRVYLSDPSKSTELIPSGTGLDDLSIEGQIFNYNQTLLKRNRLIENSSEKNPVVQELNNNLNAIRQNIMRAVDNLIVNLDIQLLSAKSRTNRTRARISAVPQQQAEVTTISRQQQIKEQLYLYLLNKREENALNKAITESTARIIDFATGSSAPVAPQSMFILMAAFLIGLSLPAAVLYILMISNITVQNRKDLTTVLSIPFLGEIPFKKVKGKDKKSGRVFIRENGRDPVSEAFRIIRTNMDFMRVKQDDIKVITVTSTNIGSGKTFISSNLAVSIAMTGKKVLLIDMDIRKGTLGKSIDSQKKAKEQNGLTNYLSKTTTKIESLIVQYENFPDVDILLSGPEPPNPAELLLSPQLDELIDKLRKMYDYIVIDNVPAGLVADAMISNRVADLTLYVVRAGKMDRRMLPEIEQYYRDEKFKNMALILNGTGVGIGYGYGYGYGYANEK